MRICVLGTGYVGLVSGACLADRGHHVVCVDVDARKVEQINRAETPIFENGLDEILARNVNTRLVATVDLEHAFANADVVLICVGTPFDGSHIDLTYILRAAEQLGELLRTRSTYCVIAVKSTVVPGTTDGPVRAVLESVSGKRAGSEFGLGMNPEFLAEGVAVRDFMQPDRIVVGGIDERSVASLASLYSSFTGVPIVRTDPRTAEAIKYASNGLLATLISFSNELGRYCEAVGNLDVADVLRGVHLMKHLSYRTEAGDFRQVSATNFLWSGCGFGGSCFPKDVRAFIANAAHHGVSTPLLEAVIDVNDTQPLRIVDMLKSAFPSIAGLRVAVLGLAFKPGTDDVRESPALKIIPELLSYETVVICHDPVALATARAALVASGVRVDAIHFTDDLTGALDDADAVLLLTSWPQYGQVTKMLAALPNRPLLIDGRRFLDKADYDRYAGVGLSIQTVGLQSD